MKNSNIVRTSMPIQFRAKFQKQLVSIPENICKKISSVTAKFVFSDDDSACLDTLWLMTVDPVESVKVFGLSVDPNTIPESYGNTEKEVSESNAIIPFSLVMALRNELRYQRKQKNPSFMELYITESCKEAFKALSNATADPIVTVVAVNHCYEVCQSSADDSIERILFLLDNDKESLFFGGIRSLWFGRKEALVLKPYAKQLHDLLYAIYQEKLANSANFVNTPLAGKLQAWRDAHPDSLTASYNEDVTEKESMLSAEIQEPIADIPESTKTPNEKETEGDNIKTFKNITASNIVEDADKLADILQVINENKELFNDFIVTYNKIVDIGYKPEEVLDKASAIQAILNAAKQLMD